MNVFVLINYKGRCLRCTCTPARHLSGLRAQSQVGSDTDRQKPCARALERSGFGQFFVLPNAGV